MTEDKKKEKEPEDPDRMRKALQFILKYAAAEKGSFCFGTIFLILGQLSDITMPLFIGHVIDLLREEKYDEVGKWCLIQIGIVVVSILILGK